MPTLKLTKNFLITLLVFALVAITLSNFAFEMREGTDGYRLGDWLINYQGGWVRRGLIGQLVFWVTSSKTSTIWITFGLQASTYLVTIIYFLKLYFAQPRQNFWLLVAFSPAFIILFSFYDDLGGFRKELLLFLAFILLIYSLRSKLIQPIYLIFSIITYGVAVFSHEIAALASPFFLYQIHLALRRNTASTSINLRDRKILLVVGGLYLILSIVSLLLTTTISASGLLVDDICRSLTSRDFEPRICAGSIAWLMKSTSFGFKEVLAYILTKNYLIIYPALLVLSLAPLLLTNWIWRHWQILIIGFVALLPLYFVAIDWGRWIYVYVTLVFLSLLISSFHENISVKNIPVVIIIAYTSLWSIPHTQGWAWRAIETYYGSGPGLGVIDIIFKQIPKDIKDPPLKDDLWIEFSKHYSRVVMLYPSSYPNSNYVLKLFSLRTGLNYDNYHERDVKFEEKNRFYVMDQERAVHLLNKIDFQKDALILVNNFYVLLPNWVLCKSCTPIPDKYNVGKFYNSISLNLPIFFGGTTFRKPIYLLQGWSEWSENWGTWTDGYKAKLLIPLVAQATKACLLFDAFGASQQSPLQLKVFLYESEYVSLRLQKSVNNQLCIEIPLSKTQDMLPVEFEFSRLQSPKQLGLSADTRLLGIGIKQVVFD